MKGLICFLCSALFCVQIYASDGYIEAARKLEEKGDYALAATLLHKNLTTSNTVANYQVLLDFNTRILQKAKPAHKYTKISHPIPASVPPKSWREKIPHYERTVRNAILIYIWPLWIYKDAYDQIKEMAEEEDKARRERFVVMPLSDGAEVEEVMKLYEIAKISVSKLESDLSNQIVSDPACLDSIHPVLEKVRSLKKELKEQRTSYLSYTVISPYLSEAERLIYIGEGGILRLRGNDRKIMDEAVRVLAKACHKNWLYEANEDVRQQFVAVQRKLKEATSKEEHEDYKVVTTLSDCVDPSKKRGADAWLP